MTLVVGPQFSPSIQNFSGSGLENNFLKSPETWMDETTKQMIQQQQIATTTSVFNSAFHSLKSFQGSQKYSQEKPRTAKVVNATAMLMFTLLTSARHPVDGVINSNAIETQSSSVKFFPTPVFQVRNSRKVENISISKMTFLRPSVQLPMRSSVRPQSIDSKSSSSSTSNNCISTHSALTTILSYHVDNNNSIMEIFQPDSTIKITHRDKEGDAMKSKSMTTESNQALQNEMDSHDLSDSLNFGLIIGNSSSNDVEHATFDVKLNETITALDVEAGLAETTREDRNEFDLNFFKSIIAGNADSFLEGESQNNYYNDTFSSGYDDIRQPIMATDSGTGNDTLRELANSTRKPQVYILVGVSVATVVLCLLAVFGLVVICRRHVILSKYNSLPSTSHSYFAYDYIYRPLHGNRLDDEYENTFVGVSIPLLQEVTVI